jgi:hypothetical protein
MVAQKQLSALDEAQAYASFRRSPGRKKHAIVAASMVLKPRSKHFVFVLAPQSVSHFFCSLKLNRDWTSARVASRARFRLKSPTTRPFLWAALRTGVHTNIHSECRSTMAMFRYHATLAACPIFNSHCGYTNDGESVNVSGVSMG